jgi:hypothetical protein
MSHEQKYVTVTTYVTTDGTIFTDSFAAEKYDEDFNSKKVESDISSKRKSQLVSIADDFGRANPYFYYISRGGGYTDKRLGLSFSDTTPKDVLKNLMVSSPKEMNKILSKVLETILKK